MTGLVGLGGCGTQNPTGCGNAANCNPIDSGAPDVVEDTGMACGNTAVCDSGADAGDAADSSLPPADSGPDTMPTCGTGNGPVCPPDASE